MSIFIRSIIIMGFGLVLCSSRGMEEQRVDLTLWGVDEAKFMPMVERCMQLNYDTLRQKFQDVLIDGMQQKNAEEVWDNLNTLNQEQQKIAMSNMIAVHECSSRSQERLADDFCGDKNLFTGKMSFKSNISYDIQPDSFTERVPRANAGADADKRNYYLYAVSAAMTIGGAVFCYMGLKNWNDAKRRKSAQEEQRAETQMCLGALLSVIGIGIGTYTYCYL